MEDKPLIIFSLDIRGCFSDPKKFLKEDPETPGYAPGIAAFNELCEALEEQGCHVKAVISSDDRFNDARLSSVEMAQDRLRKLGLTLILHDDYRHEDISPLDNRGMNSAEWTSRNPCDIIIHIDDHDQDNAGCARYGEPGQIHIHINRDTGITANDVDAMIEIFKGNGFYFDRSTNALRQPPQAQPASPA